MINIIDNISEYLRTQPNLSDYDIVDTIVNSTKGRDVIVLMIETSFHENKPLRMSQEQVKYRFRSESFETAQIMGGKVWDLLSQKENEFTFPATDKPTEELRIQRQAVESKPVYFGFTDSGQHEFIMNIVYEYSEDG